MGLRIVALAALAIHVAEEAARVFPLHVVAGYAIFHIPAGQLAVTPAAGAHTAGQRAPVAAAVPGRAQVGVERRVVAGGAKIAGVEFVAADAVAAFAARFQSVNKAVVEAVHAFDGEALSSF